MQKISRSIVVATNLLSLFLLAGCSLCSSQGEDSADRPTTPCSMRDAERLIKLTNMGSTNITELNIGGAFKKAPNEADAIAYAKVMQSYSGYLAKLKGEGKISDETILQIENKIKEMDRCKS